LMYAFSLEFDVPLFTENLMVYGNGMCISESVLATGFSTVHDAEFGSRHRS